MFLLHYCISRLIVLLSTELYVWVKVKTSFLDVSDQL